MEANINLTLTEDQVRDIIAGLTMWVSRKNSPSNKKFRQEQLAQLRKEYGEQKNLDAVCLAANGGKTDLLSGRAGELRRAINRRTLRTEFVKERSERVLELRDYLRELLPKKEEPTE